MAPSQGNLDCALRGVVPRLPACTQDNHHKETQENNLMKQFTILATAVILAAGLTPGPAAAFTSKQKVTLGGVSGGVTESTAFNAVYVTSGSSPDQVVLNVSFGEGPNTLRASGESVRVTVDTNLAANRVIMYTDNTAGTAVPKANVDTGTGNDAGGAVGADLVSIAPMLWVIAQTNVNPTPTQAGVGDDEVFIVGRGHVRTFVTVVPGQAKNGVLDNMALKLCNTATPPIPVTNIANDELYTQYFGAENQNLDICSAAAGNVTINGVTYAPNQKLPFAEELVKNIATVAFGCIGSGTGSCTAPKLDTPDPSDSITVNSPFYLPLMGDFRSAPAQTYGTNTLTVELVTQ